MPSKRPDSEQTHAPGDSPHVRPELPCNDGHCQATLRKFTRVIEQTASTVLITDANGVIEYVNPRFEEISGYTAQEAIGRRPSLLKSGHTSPEEYRQLWRTIKGGGVWQGEFHNRRKDGSLYWESATISPVRDEQGRITHFVGIKDDITARKQTEQALRESEERLTLFIGHVPAALAMFDQQMRYLAVSRRWMEDYGLGEQDIIGQSHYEIFPEIPDYWRAVHQRGLAGEIIRVEEDRFERLDGCVQWLRWEVRPWRTSGGAIGGIVIFTEDITARKQGELALAEQEARYRAVIETATDGFWMMDKRGRIIAVNDAYVRRSGFSREELLSMWIGALDARESPEETHAHIVKIMRSGSDLFETEHRTQDGEVWPVEVSASYSDSAGELFFAFLRDISERKALEREIIEISTAEQKRIGHDIHDGIGQQLTGLSLLASGIERSLTSAGQAAEAQAVAELRAHLRVTLKETRLLASGLSPVEIDPAGLVDALQQLVEWVAESTGIHCRYQGSRKVQVADSVTAVHLYRIIQEAVQNAIKHAQPFHVEVSLERTPQSLILTVQDDGKGIDLEQERRHGHLGLHIMRYRAGIIDARLDIRSGEAGGTVVRCEVPLTSRSLSRHA